MSRFNKVAGAVLFLTSLLSMALADTGPGGGCHTNFYYDLDALGNITRSRVDCQDIDCPGEGACVISSGYYQACKCPGMMEQCDLHWHEDVVTGSVTILCLFGCQSGEFTCYGPGPYEGSYGYAFKATCWCE